MNRRTFFQQSALAAALVSAADVIKAQSPANKLRVAVVALGRGIEHVKALLTLPDVDIAYLAEVDPKRLAVGLKLVGEKQQAPCRGVQDFRTFLDDKALDAVFIATPNFWHTPAALLCLQAGKHVYVEKPGSQNPREAEMLVEASLKYGRLVQMGNQRRTWMKEAIAALHEGALGTLRYGRAFYYNARPAIGQGKIPADRDLDLNLWQGPVPDERDIRPYVHYDWHWLWHWGNGELGNNGIHFLDILRWGLKVEYPLRVTSNGSRYFHQDAQETPDTGSTVYDCGAVGMSWEQSSCHPRSAEKPLAECLFYGDGGTMAVNQKDYTLYDERGTLVRTVKTAGGGDAAHIGNFLQGIREREALNSPIVEGQKSTMLCHLGNIAYRTKSVVTPDPKTGRIVEHPEAEKLWARTAYRTGWEVKV